MQFYYFYNVNFSFDIRRDQDGGHLDIIIFFFIIMMSLFIINA